MRAFSIMSALFVALSLLPGLTAAAQTTAGAGATATKTTTATVPGKSTTSAKSAKADSTSIVNINSGSATELGSLPQIGKVRTAKIVAGRPYKSVDELVTKKVLSQKLFDKLKSRLTT